MLDQCVFLKSPHFVLWRLSLYKSWVCFVCTNISCQKPGNESVPRATYFPWTSNLRCKSRSYNISARHMEGKGDSFKTHVSQRKKETPGSSGKRWRTLKHHISNAIQIAFEHPGVSASALSPTKRDGKRWCGISTVNQGESPSSADYGVRIDFSGLIGEERYCRDNI